VGSSLQDQLLQAGLVDQQQLKQARTFKRRQGKQGEQSNPDASARQRAQQAAAEKVRRDGELDRQRQEVAKRKAELDELRQLVHTNRIPRGEGDIAYSFRDGGSIKRLYVTADQRNRLTVGKLAIVRQDTGFELVSPEIAERVRARDPSRILILNKPGDDSEASGDYADYRIPDDLIW